MVLLSAQGMDVSQIAEVAFTSPDRVRAVIHNFNADGFESLYPRYVGGRPPTFTLPQRRKIKKLALSRPQDHDLPFSTWSLSKLAEFLVAEGVVDDISHERLRALLREEGVSFQALKTWKTSNDPGFEAKKNRILELYDIADGKAQPRSNGPVGVATCRPMISTSTPSSSGADSTAPSISFSAASRSSGTGDAEPSSPSCQRAMVVGMPTSVSRTSGSRTAPTPCRALPP